MSQLRTCSVKLKNPDQTLLKAAIEALAQELGAEITDRITFYYEAQNRLGTTTKGGFLRQMDKIKAMGKTAKFAIRHPVLCPGGYSVEITPQGEMKIVGDDKFYNEEYENPQQMPLDKFSQMVQQHYTTKAIARTTRQLGYHVNTKKQENKQYVYGWSM